jgi:hypothetical protein
VTPSEFAFLALGLALGIATGAAIVVVLGSRPPTHDIRLTVTRDAVPRRATTLSTEVLRAAADGPAPGGPGDRRRVDRDGAPDRTVVREIVPPRSPARTPGLVTADGRVGIPIQPAGTPDATPEPSPIAPGAAVANGTPLLPGLLAGEPRAILGLVDSLAGDDAERRRAWQELLTRFVEAVRERAIDLGFIDLPMGNHFWDTFTVDQCRQILVSLASTGRRFDGRADWADNVVPSYRDLGKALAESGIEPRRIRAWPNSHEIAELFRGAGVASGEAVAHWAPTLEPDDLRLFLGMRAAGLDELWLVWDAVRDAVAPPPPPADDAGSDDAASELAPDTVPVHVRRRTDGAELS